jgi:hypothetical protein
VDFRDYFASGLTVEAHFELVGVHNDVAAAHVFEAEECGFIVMTPPMLDEKLRISRRLVEQNRAFMSLCGGTMVLIEKLTFLQPQRLDSLWKWRPPGAWW